VGGVVFVKHQSLIVHWAGLVKPIKPVKINIRIGAVKTARQTKLAKITAKLFIGGQFQLFLLENARQI
jgi:hypothetical protein